MSDEPTQPYHLFDVTGVEVEYMIVDRTTLDVRPIADQLIEAVNGTITSEFERQTMAWSNELTLHLIEFKTNGPVATLDGLADELALQVKDANAALQRFEACLLPTAMHPWMNPFTEMKLWPHDYDVVYAAFDRIFDCRGHGWANLQSVHINLPFANDDEFGRLHAAIRLVLPLLPALAASSPFAEGAPTGWADTRLCHYKDNARKVPSVSGQIIPERVYTRSTYEQRILGAIYRDLQPLDPEGLLQHEWANARGAIARFDRNAIEIRLLDVQEAPDADVAIVAIVTAVVQALAEQRLSTWDAQKELPEAELAAVLSVTMREGDSATLEHRSLLEQLGLPGHPVRARDVWLHLMSTCRPVGADAGRWQRWYEVYANEGCLSTRLRGRLSQPNTGREELAGVYGALAACLAHNRLFTG